MTNVLLYLWQLPQNLLGLLLLDIYGRVVPIDFRGDDWRSRLRRGGRPRNQGLPGQ
ncbi:MAG: hypothetical protein IJP49_03145 [Bacteroidales bacterium]|nr:hypothetical protein [Bacteroidales bacterium]